MSLFAKIKKILVGMRLSSISNKILSDRFPKGRKFRMEKRINGGAATVSFYSRLGSAVNEADRLMRFYTGDMRNVMTITISHLEGKKHLEEIYDYDLSSASFDEDEKEVAIT